MLNTHGCNMIYFLGTKYWIRKQKTSCFIPNFYKIYRSLYILAEAVSAKPFGT